MPVTKKAKQAFRTILQAGAEHRLCLAKCEEITTGKTVYVICEMEPADGSMQLRPLSKLFNGNPYNEVTPPGLTAPKLI